MKIVLITPAPAGSRAGNRATAERWARLLRNEGHDVQVITEYEGQDCDLFIALHAWRSHGAIVSFRALNPKTPLITVLTGTDIYDHQHRFPDETLESMELADVLVGLHDLVYLDIPEQFTKKLTTVYQSAIDLAAIRKQPQPGDDDFDVCVIGHLRDVKDPLRAAYAMRHLPDHSRLTVKAAGKPHNDHWREQVESEERTNPRFVWLGELDTPEVQALMGHSRLMVISSVMEGGANVVSEACRAGLPVIASDIPGNRGLLGEGYPGYFRVGDEEDLARCLLQAEQSPEFLARLQQWVSALAPRFTPEAEQASLAQAIDSAVSRYR